METYPMIEIENYVEDITKAVFIFEEDNFQEERGFGLTIQCGLTGKKSIVEQNGFRPTNTLEKRQTRSPSNGEKGAPCSSEDEQTDRCTQSKKRDGN